MAIDMYRSISVLSAEQHWKQIGVASFKRFSGIWVSIHIHNNSLDIPNDSKVHKKYILAREHRTKTLQE